jgi:DNA replication protein DnaC
MFFLEALGQTAVEVGIKVAWFALEDLDVLVRAHRADDTVTGAVGRILGSELIMIDDIGPLPVSLDAAEGLYRLVDVAYEGRSVAVSSNLHPSGFDRAHAQDARQYSRSPDASRARLCHQR